MSIHERWGIALVVAAAAALALQYLRWRRGRLTTPHFIAGFIARAAFLFLGVVYLTGQAARYPGLPRIALALVVFGVLLDVIVGIVSTLRRRRARA